MDREWIQCSRANAPAPPFPTPMRYPRPMKRPPRDIEPRDFFERWLPELFTEEFPARRAERANGVHVRVRLDGDGGGGWDLRTDGGRLHVGAPAPGEAPVSVRQTVADWRAILSG